MAMSRARGARSVTSRSPITIVPSVTSSRPAIIRSSVDLPQPDGPTSTMNSPLSIVEVDVVDCGDAPGEDLGDALEEDAAHTTRIERPARSG